MSIFIRPDSPPPRQPSPDIMPAPLPYPHHPRRVASQPKIRAHSPSRPPGLQPPTRTIQYARSYDHMTNITTDHNSLMIPRQRTSRKQQPSPSPRNTLNVPVPGRPIVHVCPVADPPLPLAPAASDPMISSSSKRTLRSQPNSFESFYLDGMGANALPQRKPPSKPVLPPLEKHKSLGMACLRFFRLRNSSQNPAI